MNNFRQILSDSMTEGAGRPSLNNMMDSLLHTLEQLDNVASDAFKAAKGDPNEVRIKKEIGEMSRQIDSMTKKMKAIAKL